MRPNTTGMELNHYFNANETLLRYYWKTFQSVLDSKIVILRCRENRYYEHATESQLRSNYKAD